MISFGRGKSDYDKLKKGFTDHCIFMHKEFAQHTKKFQFLKMVAFCTSDKRLDFKKLFLFNQAVGQTASNKTIGSKDDEYDFYFYFVQNWGGNCIALCEHYTTKHSNYLILQFLNLIDKTYNVDIYNFLSIPFKVELVKPSSPLYKKLYEETPDITDWYFKRANQEWSEHKVAYLKGVCDQMRPGILTKDLAEI